MYIDIVCRYHKEWKRLQSKLYAFVRLNEWTWRVFHCYHSVFFGTFFFQLLLGLFKLDDRLVAQSYFVAQLYRLIFTYICYVGIFLC
jgi:hypothetical protein